jgi:hypothetical protein
LRYHSTVPLREQLISLILGDVEVRVLVEPSPFLPLLPANLEFLSVGEDKFAVCKSSFLHLMLVFPFIEGVTRTKLEFELLIFHLWFRDLLPLKSCYLLNDVNLDHPLVPRLNDSIFPGFTGLLLAEVVNDHEEGSEQFFKLCIV